MELNNSTFTIDWVLHNELAVGRAPTKKIHLTKLQQEGIVAILSLCEDSEVSTEYSSSGEFITKKIALPDHKNKRLINIEEIEEALNLISSIKKHGPVFVHCVASVERSPLICMAWLIRNHKLTVQQALVYMMQIHKGTNPLPSQLQVLNFL